MTNLFNPFIATCEAPIPSSVYYQDIIITKLEALPLLSTGVFFLIITFILPALLILLSELANIPESNLINKLDVSPKEKAKDKDNTGEINILYWLASMDGRLRLFVYDQRDPTGVNISALFAGKAYDTISRYGYTGFSVNRTTSRIQAGINNSELLKLPALTVNAAAIEGRGVIILSNNTPITRQLTQGNTNFLIVKGEPF